MSVLQICMKNLSLLSESRIDLYYSQIHEWTVL
jgi:hypothetical protein